MLHYPFLRLRKQRVATIAALFMAVPAGSGLAFASPLSLPNPLIFGAGPLGKLDVQGVASGMAFYQDNPQGGPGTLGAKRVGADITNGMVIIQKENGPIQFYLQAGAYSFPTLAAAIPSASSNIQEFGALPVAYLKIAPSSDYSVEIGQLPTLIGGRVDSPIKTSILNGDCSGIWSRSSVVACSSMAVQAP